MCFMSPRDVLDTIRDLILDRLLLVPGFAEKRFVVAEDTAEWNPLLMRGGRGSERLSSIGALQPRAQCDPMNLLAEFLFQDFSEGLVAEVRVGKGVRGEG